MAYLGKSLVKPVIGDGVLRRLCRSDCPSNEAQLRCLDGNKPLIYESIKREAALVENFIELVSMLGRTSRSTSPDGTMAWPVLAYVPKDHQSTPVPGCAHQVDCVLYRRDASGDISTIHVLIEAKSEARAGALRPTDLGQVPDYAQVVWRHQLTRVFVPMLPLVFRRRKCYQCEVGAEKPPSVGIRAAPIMKRLLALIIARGSSGYAANIC